MDKRWLSEVNGKNVQYIVQLYTVCDIYTGELFVKNFLQNVQLDPSVLNESEAKFPSQSNSSLNRENVLKGTV